jgi:DNA-directed RNA polymerase specialized sigma24 family protein
MSPRQLALVEARFFGGMSNDECAEFLQCSETTLLRDWRAARAWLGREVRRSLMKEPGTQGPAAETKPALG